ncbi:carboxysome shell protein [Thiosulfatimonas sediminis]|uniref:Carboxysome shell carbonic anhydrase n=1 Tax=Thiosulfatimonas sediminis TaxID=2675054 RepID=A0A6F8PSB3_9GAMM|nr:carboxysome shell carbonic anhydrase [Thiosulfatimonas sediminis]BBP44924.1 carboxysome shell protein [Thiosulfatimonas sediminis]
MNKAVFTKGARRKAAKQHVVPVPYKNGLVPHLFAPTFRVGHPLVDTVENQRLRDYELTSKARFDRIETLLPRLQNMVGLGDFSRSANAILQAELGFKLPDKVLAEASVGGLNLSKLYAQCVFEQYLAFSQEFFEQDPLKGQQTAEVAEVFQSLGYHSIGVAPCADGRLAHFVSYILRLPYSLVRRKAHAGALFDVSESVRNWVFTEHLRFREAKPNAANEATRYLKIASYHFSKSDPHHQGCAAHGSDDTKAARAALDKLNAFKQAIEDRFGCGATVDIALLGVNTDDDSLRVHIPDEYGQVGLADYVDSHLLYHQTLNLDAEQARAVLVDSLRVSHLRKRVDKAANLRKLLAWLLERNLAQIDYVHHYESGCYSDIGHAERFIGIGNGFSEVQLRNLTYYSFLETLEEGLDDVKVGIKIFKKLNLTKMLPIPLIVGFEYDGRVPGSKDRAANKAKRIAGLVQQRFAELSATGMLHTMCTLRDYSSHRPAFRLDND